MGSENIDSQIATRVMGWPDFPMGKAVPDKPPYPHCRSLPSYLLRATETILGPDYTKWSPSTDPAAAWEVAEELRRRGLLVSIKPWGGSPHGDAPEGNWRVMVWVNGNRDAFFGTMPMALANAALACSAPGAGKDEAE